VVRPKSSKQTVYPGKRPKKAKGPSKNFEAGSGIWDQISEIWHQKGQPGNAEPDRNLHLFTRPSVATLY